MQGNYQNTVESVYGRKKEYDGNRHPRQTPEPHHVFDGPNKGTYCNIVVSRLFKKGKGEVTRYEYLSAYLSGYLIAHFANPKELNPVTDKSHPLYDDTLEYDASNKTFCVKRFIHKTKNVKTLVVFTSKLELPIVPGSVKNLRNPKQKKYNPMNRRNADDHGEDHPDDHEEDDDQPYPPRTPPESPRRSEVHEEEDLSQY